MSTVSQKPIPLPETLTIPTMPAIIQRVTTLLQDPNVGLRDIALVVTEDAPLAAKALKIANSTYYGLRERCMSAQAAAAVLGVRVLKNVVMQASVIKQFDHLSGQGVDLNEMWKHSIVTAQACAFIARRAKVRLEITSEDAYACGLLHDLGEIVLLDNYKQRYIHICNQARSSNLPLFVVEQQALGFTHADVGGRIAQRWGLPAPVVRAVSFHHAFESDAVTDPVVGLIARVNVIVERVAGGNVGGASGLLGGKVATLLGVQHEDETALIDFVRTALQSVEI